MLRHERQVQDENAGVLTERRLGGKGAFGTPLANDAEQKGLGSSREAFGGVSKNISLLNPHAPLKGQQTTARRALGDITNATPQRRPQHQVQAKAAGRTEAVAGVKPVAAPRDLAEVYADGGTESCAGMTWRQQEQLRERQQDADIAARVKAFNSVPFRIPQLPSYRSGAAVKHDQGSMMGRASLPAAPAQKLDLDVLRPEALMLQTPALDWTFGGTFPEVILEDPGDEQE